MTTVVVLGMHRSGTSCVTRALHEGGMYLGTNLMNQTASDNAEGHWEAWEALRINEEILEASGATWYQAPIGLPLVAPPGIEARMAGFLQELASHPVSGFKDPRTVITFPLWKPHLKDLHVVACLRHPYNVARSLARRHASWTIEQGLELWLQYNSRLLEYTAALPAERIHWFDFDAPVETAEAALTALLSRLGLAASNTGFNPFLRHHDQHPAIEHEQVASVYEALREQAAAQRERLASEQPECEESATSGCSAGEPGWQTFETRLRQLGTVHCRHDELIQRQQAALWNLERQVAELQSHDPGAADREELARRCAESERRITALEQAVFERDDEARRNQRQFEARLEECTSAICALTEQVHGYQEQLSLYKDQLSLQREQIALYKDQLNRLEKRHLLGRIAHAAKALVNRVRHLPLGPVAGLPK